MAEIEFEEDKTSDLTLRRRFQKKSMMVSFLLKTGIAKDEMMAKIILISIVAICTTLSIYILATFVFGANNETSLIDSYKKLTPEQKNKLPPFTLKRIEKLQKNAN